MSASFDIVARIAAFATGSDDQAPDAEVRLLDLVRELRARPLNAPQVASLALRLAKSGRIIDWSGDPRLAGKVSVDLPSTGGTSNKSPIIAPLIALAAARDRIYIPKFSSRGQFGGTIDILESVGYEATVPLARYREIVATTGISNVVQGREFAPADGELMSLRRRVGAMDVPELVVSSILAKKLASGCRHIVVDMKTGLDSKFGDLNGVLAGARLFAEAAKTLIDDGHLDGIWVCCTNGSRPQGRTFGRLAALWECARVLSGAEPGFLLNLSVSLAARMLVLTGAASDVNQAGDRCHRAIGSQAIATARPWLAAHGSRTDFLENCDVLLEGLDELRFESPTGGALLKVDLEAIKRLLERLAGSPGGKYAAGVVFDGDPFLGRALARPLSGRVLGPAGTRWPSDVLRAAGSTVIAYRGAVPIHEQPLILFERSVSRHGETEDPCWSRASRSSAAIVRRGNGEILLAFNKKWNCWNLPAGHFEPDRDSDLADTIGREIAEELGPEIGELAPEPGVDFTYLSSGHLREIWRSGSADAWTYYDLELFSVAFADARWLEDLVGRNPAMLRWANASELTSGRLADGASLAAFPVTLLALDGAFSGA